MPKTTTVRPARSADFIRQKGLDVYGDGPYDPAVGHPCGCEDVARITLAPGFSVVRDAHLDKLEAALQLALRTFDEVLPKFNWGASALDANAIQLLNEAPLSIRAALQP